jgi:hypothetical protein
MQLNEKQRKISTAKQKASKINIETRTQKVLKKKLF